MFMEKLNNLSDVEAYLNFGNLTQPFLGAEYILGRVQCDMSAKNASGTAAEIQSLMNWICSKVKYARGEREYICQNQFKRSAKEIWESGKTVGCGDYALLFTTFARQIGISTSFLHTASAKWLEKLANGEKIDKNCGHSFCECFVDGQWILVDPTNKRIVGEYSPENIQTNYLIGGDSEFVPYFRGLDLVERMGLRAHNEMMNVECKKLLLNKFSGKNCKIEK